MKRRAAFALVSCLSGPGCRAEGPVVAFLGDSLTSGWRLREAKAYPALLERSLREGKHPIRALNLGVNGNTAGDGLARLDGALRRKPDVLVVALGINDGLRGLPLDATESALRQIVERARAAGARVLLVGMRIPEGMGAADDAARFGDLYPRLAAEYRVPLVPFLLDGVAGNPELVHRDGIHPTAAGQVRLAENVRPHLELLLAELPPPRR
jgi:acyl-CoA thioesterase-1